MRVMEKGELLSVGDFLETKHAFGGSRYKITRVTKTLALSKREDGFEHRFTRSVSFNMSKPCDVWSMTRYKAITNNPRVIG